MRIKIFLFTLLFLGFGLSEIFAQADAGAPAGQASKTVSGGVVNGQATSLVKPAYPAAARAVRAEGAVNVQVTIDEEGRVISASAVSGHPLLRAAAEKAARESKFSPTRLQGQSVKVTGVIVYNFVLPKQTAQPESERLIPMGLVMFLTALKDIPGDEESDRILLDLGNEMPAAMKTDKAQFERLVSAKSQDEKSKIIDEIVASMRRDLTGTDAWMVDLGKNWGGAIGEAFRITDSEYRRDRQNFIKNLEGMNWLLESPPKGISEVSLDKIRAIAAYNGENDRVTPQFINNFFKTSLDFIDYMVSDGKK
jgi:TonB family protein